MFKNKLTLISIMLLFLFAVGIASASDNVTDDFVDMESDIVEIESTDEDVSLGVSEEDSLQKTVTVTGNTFDDIQDAVDSASKGDVIKLSGTYSGSYSISVKKSITLQGDSKKATLLMDGYSSIIQADNVKVTLKNIIFKNSGYSAIIVNSGATIQNCIFENSEDYAISCQDSAQKASLIVKNSVFKNNWGGIGAQLKSLTVEQSTFTGNKECAIHMNSFSSTSFSIKDSTFTGNSAGALWADIEEGSGTIDNCIFNSNNAEDNGGAIYLSASEKFTVNVLNSTFNSNSAPEDSAMYIHNAIGNIKDNKFSNNKAKDTIASVGTISPSCVLQNNIISSNANAYDNLKIEFLNVPSYYGDVCQVKFTKDGKPLSNKKISATAYAKNHMDVVNFNFVTDSNGIGKFAFASSTVYMNLDIWDVQFVADSGSSKIVVSSNNLNIKQLPGNLVLNDFTTTYNSGKYYSVKLLNKNTNAAAGNVRLHVVVLKNGYYYNDFHIVTDLNGVAKVKLSNLGVGNYKFSFVSGEIDSIFALSEKTSKIKINKAPTKVKAPKVTNKFKKSKYFKVTVKAYSKPVNKLKIKVKVYTGKKSKTYSIKTNKKGVAKLNTKKLSKGKHKVVISSGNANYKISAKSAIKIK